MDLLISILAIIAGIIGIIGSIMPGLPGLPLSWLGLLLIYLNGGKVSLTALIVWLIIVVIVSILDYIIPSYLTKITGGSKYASKGAMIGLFVGLILTPIGMILGSFLGAFIGEYYYAKKEPMVALKAATGSFIGFMLGTGIKTIFSVSILIAIIVALI